jgi:hypothetical protein
MRGRPDPDGSVDALFAEVLRSGESTPRLRELLLEHDPDELTLLALLRRAVPLRLLEQLGTQPPWSESRRVLGGVVLNPRTPQHLALRLVPSLFWRDLAEAAASPRLSAAVRLRAEAVLKEQIPDLRLGEKITLAHIATVALLPLLLAEADHRVAAAALDNPRLREADLVVAIRQDTVPVVLLEQVAASTRWREAYALRLELVLQKRTPLGIALAQMSSLVPRDLRRIAEARELATLLRATAERLAEPGRPEGPEESGGEPGP